MVVYAFFCDESYIIEDYTAEEQIGLRGNSSSWEEFELSQSVTFPVPPTQQHVILSLRLLALSMSTVTHKSTASFLVPNPNPLKKDVLSQVTTVSQFLPPSVFLVHSFFVNSYRYSLVVSVRNFKSYVHKRYHYRSPFIQYESPFFRHDLIVTIVIKWKPLFCTRFSCCARHYY
jgi:hypothetical protein